MSKKIRVLALNDDNHKTTFHSEWSQSPYTTLGFVQKLAKPHTDTYEIRYVSVLDLNGDNAQIDIAFDVVQMGGHHKSMNYFTAFEILWDATNKIL